MLCKVFTAAYLRYDTLLDKEFVNAWPGQVSGAITTSGYDIVKLITKNLGVTDTSRNEQIWFYHYDNSHYDLSIPYQAVLNEELIMPSEDASKNIQYSYLMSGSYKCNWHLTIIGCTYREKPEKSKKLMPIDLYSIWENKAFILFGMLPSGEFRFGN